MIVTAIIFLLHFLIVGFIGHNQIRDEVELGAIRYCARYPEHEERLVPFTSQKGEAYYHFSQPIRVVIRCLKCHGSRDEVPPAISERYSTGYDFTVGDIQGNLSIKLPARLIEERVSAQLLQSSFTHLAGIVVGFLLLSGLLSKTVLTPISRLQQATMRLVHGDYSARAAQPGNEEIAEVSRSFDKMIEEIGNREKALTIHKAL